MMEALRSQTGDVKATQKLEQQEADISPEAAETMSEGGDQCAKAWAISQELLDIWTQSRSLFIREWGVAKIVCTMIKRAPLPAWWGSGSGGEKEQVWWCLGRDGKRAGAPGSNLPGLGKLRKGADGSARRENMPAAHLPLQASRRQCPVASRVQNWVDSHTTTPHKFCSSLGPWHNRVASSYCTIYSWGSPHPWHHCCPIQWWSVICSTSMIIKYSCMAFSSHFSFSCLKSLLITSALIKSFPERFIEES